MYAPLVYAAARHKNNIRTQHNCITTRSRFSLLADTALFHWLAWARTVLPPHLCTCQVLWIRAGSSVPSAVALRVVQQTCVSCVLVCSTDSLGCWSDCRMSSGFWDLRSHSHVRAMNIISSTKEKKCTGQQHSYFVVLNV